MPIDNLYRLRNCAYAGNFPRIRKLRADLGLGLNLYAADSSCYVPGYYFPNGGGEILWFDVLKPYVGARWPAFNWSSSGTAIPQTGTYVCPSYDRMPGIYCGGPRTPSNFPGGGFGAYGYNWGGIDTISPPNLPCLGLGGHLIDAGSTVTPTRGSEVLDPAEMIAFGDAPLDTSAGTYAGLPASDCGLINLAVGLGDTALNLDKSADPALLASYLAAYQRRHSGQFNISFVDGHVESGPPSRFFGVGSAQAGNGAVVSRWNNDHQPHLDRFLGWF